MPQASDELRKKWGGEVGVSEDKAYEFLISKGWKCYKGAWTMPDHVITSDECEAISFLLDEWDHAIVGDDLRRRLG